MRGNASHSYTTTTNTTSIMVSDHLTQGVVYSVTVAGVHAEGAIGMKNAGMSTEKYHIRLLYCFYTLEKDTMVVYRI